MVNVAKNFLIMKINPQQIFIKLYQKEQFKKQKKQTGDLIRIFNKITRISKTLQKNNSDIVTN